MSTTSTKPAVLVVGTGFYVCGRGTAGFGTVLPTLVQAQAEGRIGELFIAGRSSEGLGLLQEKLRQFSQVVGVQPRIRFFPQGPGEDPYAYRQALAEIRTPACAVVVVPDHLHASITEELMAAGLHALVVKPLTPTVAEARRLIDTAQANQVYGATDFHKRFDEANLLLRQTLAEGRLGTVRYITVEFSQRRLIQRAFQAWLPHTNIFQYLGVHYVDLIFFVTGARPIRVLATGQPRERIPEGLWRLDAIQALIEWEGAPGQTFVSSILTNWIDPDQTPGLSNQRILVVGTEGRYDSEQRDRGVEMTTNRGIEQPSFYFTQLTKTVTGAWSMEGYGPRCIQQFLADVRDIVDGRCQPADFESNRPSFQESLVSTAVIEAVNQSLVRGEAWVDVEDVVTKPVAAQPASR